MCNDFEQQIAWAAYCELMQAIELGIPTQQSELLLPQAADIRINDFASVITLAGEQAELSRMGFGFPPQGKGGPVFNFRADGRRFDTSKRCVVPASAFFEFTGKKYPKAKHRFTLVGQPILGIAGLWREGKGNFPPAFTLLTVEPGPDVAPYHSRQIVVLEPASWEAWLRLSQSEQELLRPLPADSLQVETVRAGSD